MASVETITEAVNSDIASVTTTQREVVTQILKIPAHAPIDVTGGVGYWLPILAIVGVVFVCLLKAVCWTELCSLPSRLEDSTAALTAVLVASQKKQSLQRSDSCVNIAESEYPPDISEPSVVSSATQTVPRGIATLYGSASPQYTIESPHYGFDSSVV